MLTLSFVAHDSNWTHRLLSNPLARRQPASPSTIYGEHLRSPEGARLRRFKSRLLKSGLKDPQLRSTPPKQAVANERRDRSRQDSLHSTPVVAIDPRPWVHVPGIAILKAVRPPALSCRKTALRCSDSIVQARRQRVLAFVRPRPRKGRRRARDTDQHSHDGRSAVCHPQLHCFGYSPGPRPWPS